MRFLGKYIGRPLGRLLKNRLSGFVGSLFPSCAEGLAISWHKNLNTVVSEGSEITIEGLLDFDGIDDAVAYTGELYPDITGDKSLYFNLYLNKDSGYNSDSYGNPIISLHDSSSGSDSHDGFFVYLSGSNLIVTVGRDYPTYYGGTFDITGMSEQILECIVTKNTHDFISLTINGVLQTSSEVPSVSTNLKAYFGRLTSYYLEDALLWDIKVYDNPSGDNTLVHEWAGYPNGNQDSAWVDQAGSLDFIVEGTPTTIDVTTGSSAYYIKDSIGEDTRDVYYGQYLSSGIINFYRTSGTFDYTDPSDGSTVTGESIPTDGLYTIPSNGICDIVTSDGSKYPIVEGVGEVLHDVNENSTHISVDTPTWAEGLYGSDYLNQYGYVTKDDFTTAGYSFVSEVNGTTTTLDDDCLIPLRQE